MKARYSYPIYPKTHQLESLAKAMGCIVTEEHYLSSGIHPFAGREG
ncbi:MAG: helix-turn-helix domain-containing protein [Xenococcaceae cyanobacterium MO_167.B27]|nr:helix-turn-helix domain-containing protein [Xenococcaceae cyanobacterium MO_167.B27]